MAVKWSASKTVPKLTRMVFPPCLYKAMNVSWTNVSYTHLSFFAPVELVLCTGWKAFKKMPDISLELMV